MNFGAVSDLVVRELPCDVRMVRGKVEVTQKNIYHTPTPLMHYRRDLIYHASCQCNILAAIKYRLQRPMNPRASDKGLTRFKEAVSWFRDQLRDQAPIALTLKQALQRCPPAKKALYLQAYESLLLEPISRRDARIHCFVKADKCDILGDNPEKLIKPRMISKRTPRYTLKLSRYAQPLEKCVARVKSPITGTRYSVKGLDQYQRGDLLVLKMSYFHDVVVVGVDASSYDTSFSPKHKAALDTVYSVYDDRELAQMLDWRMSNKVTTDYGVSFTLAGQIQSGDRDTALYGSIGMISHVRAAMAPLMREYDVMNDGDDCLIIFSKSAIPQGYQLFLEQLKNNLAEQNISASPELQYTPESPYVENLDFCRSHFVEYAPGKIRSVPRVRRAMARLGSSHFAYRSGDWRKRLTSAIIGDLYVFSGMPVIQPAVLKIQELFGKGKVDKMLSFSYKAKLLAKNRRPAAAPITPLTRASFAIAFNMPVGEQLFIERQIANWKVGDFERRMSTTQDIVNGIIPSLHDLGEYDHYKIA